MNINDQNETTPKTKDKCNCSKNDFFKFDFSMGKYNAILAIPKLINKKQIYNDSKYYKYVENNGIYLTTKENLNNDQNLDTDEQNL